MLQSEVMRAVAFPFALFLLLAPVRAEVTNGDFEETAVAGSPTGWLVPGMCAAEGWRVETVGDAAEGERAGRLFSEGQRAPNAFGNLMQSIDAEPFQGSRVRLTAQVNFHSEAPHDRLQMWMRVDREGGGQGFFDNMGDRPVTDAGWREVTIVGDVADDAAAIALGFMILGSGRSSAILDDVRLEVLGEAGVGDVPAAALAGEALENIAAFARLVGAVRYFHPADEAVNTDWLIFTVTGLEKVEKCSSSEELATTMQRLFKAIAPTVQVWSGAADGGLPEVERQEAEGEWIVGIRHTGLGVDLKGTQENNIYVSKRLREKPKDVIGVLPEPPFETVMDLGAGVAARIPHVLHADAEGTLPRTGEDAAVELNRPQGWRPSASDRSVRVAVVIEAWNVWQHFYPYWDVIDTDWPAQLRQSLAASAEAEDGEGLRRVLAELVAAGQDGHGNLAPGESGFLIPVVAEWVEGKLAIIEAPENSGMKRGDSIEAIEGTSVDEVYNLVSAEISASTEGWLRHKAIRDILSWGRDDPVNVTIERADGSQLSVPIQRVSPAEWWQMREERPALGEEVAPGIRYVDLHGLGWEELEGQLDVLADADGIVFDLRGYPDSAGVGVLHRLTDKQIHSAFWNIPQYMKPDQLDVEYLTSRWNVMPMQPRLTSNVAFITDGRAISYAESCLAIVEAYDLGEIVGATTAGTNGNINSVQLPCGFSMIWTGMRVVKHDGETVHQGVGVKPTLPCDRTIAGVAAGRDELLEKAVEVLKNNGR